MNATRRFRVSCVLAIATVLFALLISSQASAQVKKNLASNLSPGDRVEVRQGNKWRAGEAVEVTRGGLVKVRLAGTPASRVVRVPKQLVRRAKAADSTPAANSPPASQARPDLRVWTDRTGQRKVEAEFVDVAEGKVTLRKKDGTLAVLSLDRLAKQDQDFVASLADDGGDASPDDVLRQFLVALAGGKRRQTAALMAPHPNAAVLFSTLR